jgi:DNA polymerase-3 subunit delta'
MVFRTTHNLRLPFLSERTRHVLATLIKNRRIPQALLFAGIDGIGKSIMAALFAKAVNCNNAPNFDLLKTDLDEWSCGKCQTCRKIDSGNHPDIIKIEPQKDQLRIDTIRSVITHLGFTPYSARHRIVLIGSAEKMTPAAGNALLKILEEPPKQTHFFMTAAKVTDLLPTIQSRCQIVRLLPWPDRVIVSKLVEELALDQTTAATTVKLAGGSQIKAMALAKQNWISNHRWAIDALGKTEKLHLRQLLHLAERLSRKKNDLENLLIWYKTVILDDIKKHTVKLKNNETGSPSGSSVNQLLQKYEIIEDSLLQLSTNANRRMVLEKMLLDLAVDSALGSTE